MRQALCRRPTAVVPLLSALRTVPSVSSFLPFWLRPHLTLALARVKPRSSIVPLGSTSRTDKERELRQLTRGGGSGQERLQHRLSSTTLLLHPPSILTLSSTTTRQTWAPAPHSPLSGSTKPRHSESKTGPNRRRLNDADNPRPSRPRCPRHPSRASTPFFTSPGLPSLFFVTPHRPQPA